MGEALLVRKGGGGSKVINGILEEYYAESDVISADTFISFLDNVPTTYFSNTSRSNSEPPAIQAIKLSTTKVLMIIAPTYTYQQQYAVIDLGADGAVIGTTTVYSTPAAYYAQRPLDIAYIKVSDTDIFLFFFTGRYSTAALVGLWVSVNIETNEVTVEANPYTIDSSMTEMWMLSNAIKLESNKFLIVTKETQSSKYPVYAYVMQINASAKTVTVLNKLTLTTTESYGGESYPRLIRMSEEQYCLLRRDVAVCTFNLDSTYSTVSNYLKTKIGTPTNISNVIYICKISSNRVIVFFAPNTTTLSASFVTINNGIVNVDKTISEAVSFSSNIIYGYLQAYYEEGEITLYMSDCYTSQFCKKIIFEVNDGASSLTLKSNTDLFDSTTDGTATKPSGDTVSVIPYSVLPLTHNSLLMMLCLWNGFEEAFKVIRSEKTAIPATSKIDGLTKNQLSTTKKGKVWTLE